MDFSLRIVNIARCLSTSRHYPKNIEKMLLLDYQKIDREGLFHPARTHVQDEASNIVLVVVPCSRET